MRASPPGSARSPESGAERTRSSLMRHVLAAALGLALASFAPPAHAMTVDEIVARNLDARGGIDKLRALQSLRLTGKARYGGGEFVIEAAYASEVKRGSGERTEASFQGL